MKTILESLAWHFSIALTITLLSSPANGADEASLILGRPQVAGSVATYPLTLDFSTDMAEELVFFSLDVSSSAAELTVSGTDYSVFSFSPASPLFDDFSLVPGTEFGPGMLASIVQYDTVTTSLTPGIYDLGKLSVDFTGSGLTSGDLSAISLDADDSVIGVETSGQPATFRFIDLDFLLPPVTQPIDSIVANESDFLLTIVSGNSDSTTVPGSPANILGGKRDVEVSFSQGFQNGLLATLKNDGEDVLDFVASAEAVGKLELTYGKIEELNADFLLSATDPFNAVIVDMASVDGSGSLIVELESNGIFNSLELTVDKEGEIAFPYASFPDVDLLAIDTVKVTLEGLELAADFSIRSIVLGQVIPEPRSMNLILFAAILVRCVCRPSGISAHPR